MLFLFIIVVAYNRNLCYNVKNTKSRDSPDFIIIFNYITQQGKRQHKGE